jgi:hypothetical protein
MLAVDLHGVFDFGGAQLLERSLRSILRSRLDRDAREDTTVATQRLLALAADAEHRRFIGWALEARVAAWQLLHERQAAAARALREDIEKSARQHGFGRILTLLAHGDSAAVRG